MMASVRNMPLRLDKALLPGPGILVLAPMAAGLVLRLQKAWGDIRTLLLEGTSDDAFYYFNIARNIANGHNVTFDGETLTNGFHPLWMALVTPIYLFSNDAELSLHLALTLASLFGAGTVLLVYVIVRTLTENPWASLVAATFYALHAYLIVESVNGMETAVTVFMVALTVWLFLRIARWDDRTSLHSYVWLGVSGGLMVLARTDTAFMLPPMLLLLVAREHGARARTEPIAAGGLALAVIAPWAIWSLVSFGTVVQVSGVAVAHFGRENFLELYGSSFATQIDHAWDITSHAFSDLLPRLYFVPRGGPRVLAMLTAVGLLAFSLVAPFSPQRRLVRRQVGLLLVPTLGVVLALVFHTAIRWNVREWYFAPAGLLGTALLGILIDYVHGLLKRGHLTWGRAPNADNAAKPPQPIAAPPAESWRAAAITVLYALAALTFVSWFAPYKTDLWVAPLPHRANMLDTAEWLGENTPSDARVGSLNAGIIGYFSGRTVVNLDGVVNEEAYEARRDDRLLEYVDSKEIDYLVDLQTALDFAFPADERPSGFRLVATIGHRLPYFGGALLDVLELEPEAASRRISFPHESGSRP